MRMQRGAALMVILVILGVVGAYFALKALNSGQARRDMETANTLAQAKEALIGYAITYRENDPLHASEVYGYLPCPDIDNNGIAEGNCGALDVSQTGRLPWSTLKLSPLRDSHGECLWFAVSGTAKNNPKTAAFNWDTPGQFIVRDTAGNTLTGATVQEQALAVILAPHGVIGTQTRPSVAGSECGGSNAVTDYLENTGTPNTIVLSTPDSVANSSNNDRGLWITSKDVFDRVKNRADFKSDIDTMMDDLSAYLTTNLANASADNKGISTLITNFLTPTPAGYEANTIKRNVLDNWKNNLLYAKGGSVPGKTCNAVLIFGGERTTTQTRVDDTTRNDRTNYLENGNEISFPANPQTTNAGLFAASSGDDRYDPANPSRDLIRCITGSSSPSSQVSFDTDFSSFTPTGAGVTTNPDGSVSIAIAGGASGGCFWFANPIPLAGKTLRAYYEYRFSNSDSRAITGSGPDLGYGFSLQMVRGDFGTAPNTCGSQSRMGVLNDPWGALSIVFESDVYRTSGDSDPTENHTAIMLNGNLNHSLSGTMSTACNGTASGCRHSPANKFEENPLLSHNQRIEITTGCNSACSICNPASHGAPNNYARTSVWVDCSGAGCSDITTNFIQTPTIKRCTALYPELNSFYFGFTGGFSNGGGGQGINLRNFTLRYDE